MIGYVRVSRAAGREDLVSPEIQRRKIQEWAALHDAEIVRWFDELDEPGSKLERPLFQEALRLCENGTADGIAVYRLDRFARSVVHGLDSIKRLQEAGARFVSVSEGFDAGTDVGRLVITILFAFAELELGKIKQNWAHAVQQAIDAGKYVSSIPPIGYRKNEQSRLVVDPDVAPHVKALFLMRTAGKTWGELAEYMEQQGMITGRGNAYWTPSATRQIVLNRAYLGEARNGELVNATAHEPIVTEKEWHAAQPSENIILPKAKSHSANCVLRGVLVCGGCGHKMLVGVKTKGKNRKPYYYCRGRYSTGRCPARPTANHKTIDTYVEEQLLAAFHGDGPLAEALVQQDEIERAVRELDAARFALSAYVSNATLIETIGLEAFNTGAAAHQKRVDLAEMVLEDVRSQQDAAASVPEGDLLEAWKGGNLTPLERRLIVSKMVERVILHRTPPTKDRAAIHIGARVQIVLRGNQLLAGPAGAGHPTSGL